MHLEAGHVNSILVADYIHNSALLGLSKFLPVCRHCLVLIIIFQNAKVDFPAGIEKTAGQPGKKISCSQKFGFTFP